MVLRKFKHYATDDVVELEVYNGGVDLDGKFCKLGESKPGITISGTSWLLIKNE